MIVQSLSAPLPLQSQTVDTAFVSTAVSYCRSPYLLFKFSPILRLP
jgi:hypothetical protein